MNVTGSKLKRLLVEDNEDDIVLLREAFGDEEFVKHVDVVRDGVQAPASLRREPPNEESSRRPLILSRPPSRRTITTQNRPKRAGGSPVATPWGRTCRSSVRWPEVRR